jgi:transposase
MSWLGFDETRFASVRWILDGITWKRSDPWLTFFVDCSADGPGSLLGLAPGRTGACVRDWLAEQTEQFRAAIQLVVIDPSAPYDSGIRAALLNALIAVDGWHLVVSVNQAVTEVRQRVTRDLLGFRWSWPAEWSQAW